ncbi:hypothetical protein F2Q70_00030127 [Brassica cretica]|uniref:Uncharacterized protein n=1 Tax=Brassica cretica TaxID=69181 RepID=A0A8S9FJG3_BRACR|nr:hypothetical protein F2Q70_00030127 [Brassica cretica]KAF3488725.1 hypothetical protein F2Q69_00053397 [Brassica cretica]
MSTALSIQASTIAFMSSRVAVLCSCFKAADEPQPSSISKLMRLSSPQCQTMTESGPSRSHYSSIIRVVSQLLFSRCGSSSP